MIPLVVTMSMELLESEGDEEKTKTLPWALPKMLINRESSVEHYTKFPD